MADSMDTELPDHYNSSQGRNLSDFVLWDPGELIFDVPIVRSFFIAIYTVVFVLCFFGNLAVVVVVKMHWRMKSVTKFFLGNLAFANMCVGVFCVYQNLSTYLTERWPFGVFLCKMYHFTNSLSHTASILILVVISIERYSALFLPFLYRRYLTLCRLKMIICGVWGLSALLASPRLYYIDIIAIPWRLETGELVSETICAPRKGSFDYKAADIVEFVVQFCLPMAIITALYTRIGLYLRRWEKLIVSESNNNKNGSLNKPKTVEEIRAGSDPSGKRSSHRNDTSLNKNYSNIGKRPKEPEVSIMSATSVSGYFYQGYNAKESEGCQISVVDKASVDVRKNSKKKSSRKLRVQFSKEVAVLHNQRDGSVGCSSVKRLSSCDAPTAGFSLNKNESQIYIDTISEVPPTHPIQNQLMGQRERTTVKKSLSQVQRRRRQVAVRMLITIVASFAVCNLPYHVRKICQNYMVGYNFASNLYHVFSLVTFLLMYTNCAINPILYGFMSTNFRRSFRDLITCKLRRRREALQPIPP